MKLERVDPFNDEAVAATRALSEAARVVDTPWDPPEGPVTFAGRLRHGWDGEPDEVWLLYDGDAPIAKLTVNIPQRDNRHTANVFVQVHPDHRRRGHGRALLEEGLTRVKAAGRRLALAYSIDAPGPSAFMRSAGFTSGSVEILRRQDLHAVDHTRIAKLREEARAAARDYTLLRLPGAVPDHLVDEVAAITAAINDAPYDDLEIEDEVYDAKRIRDFEAAHSAAQLRVYRLVARLGDDGPLAGQTIVAVPSDQPGWAWQYDTSVVRAHRGHRLGLLLKSEMLAWLAEAEPAVRWIDTWNAESNAHMIAVNEALGYSIVTRGITWQRAV
jgi:GNAT superfamily N-acetyltransferase